MDSEQIKKPTLAEWLNGQVTAISSQMQGFAAQLRSNAKALRAQQEATKDLQSVVTNLAHENAQLKAQVVHALKVHQDLQGSNEQVQKTVLEEFSDCTPKQLLEYLQQLVTDLSTNTTNSGDEGKGANIIGFNRELNYDSGTVGDALKTLFKSFDYQPTFFNLGPPMEIHVSEEITVRQTNTLVMNPGDQFTGKVLRIKGGDLEDLLMLTSRSPISFSCEGNIMLKTDFLLQQYGILVLRRVKQGWKPVWYN